MKPHVLVIGAAGYLGSVLYEHLLEAGYRVTAMDKLTCVQHSLFLGFWSCPIGSEC